MGDHFQTIVDLDATEADATALAARGLDWLVREQFVSAERTNCVLGAPLGNPPGSRWAAAVLDPDWPPSDGLNIETGRSVFHGGQDGAEYAQCPRCEAQTRFTTETWDDIEGAFDPFRAAMTLWHESGEAAVVCGHCEQAADLRSWRWPDDYFAFGYLGFEFWNWPEFDPRFVAEFAEALGGHRLVLVWGKL